MRNTWLALLACILMAGLSSCSEDFEVAAPYKNVTVVYGLLNIGDTAHYIRIQKAFLDDSKSALEMAQEKDSNFYASLDVRMKEIDTTTNPHTVRATYLLGNPVDLASEGYPKEPGAFFNTPNLAYKFKHALNPAYRYRIVVSNLVTGEIDSAETTVISNDPLLFRVNEMDGTPSYTIDFSNPPGVNKNIYNLIVNRIPSNAKYFEASIRFHWVDRDILNGNQQTDHVAPDWMFASEEYKGSAVNLSVGHISFYTFLRAAMQPAPAHIERYMDSCDLFVWAGSQELYDYKKISESQGGLTGDQIKPIYTNIKGASVLGLFASRALRAKYSVPISSVTIDSLKVNAITNPLNIRGVSDH